jgi:hypothetical protein
MSKRASKAKPVEQQILKSPWPIITGFLFGLILVLTLFFMLYGISPEMKIYTLSQSSDYLKILSDAHLSIAVLSAFLTGLSLLVGLGFTSLAAFLLLRRLLYVKFLLTAFVLLLLPYSLNAVSVLARGIDLAQLGWLYSLLRAAGLFLTGWLVLVFPNGYFVPKWVRWSLIGLAVWAILSFIALINPAFLPGAWIDFGWIIIIALGFVSQDYRYLHFSSPTERRQIRRMGLALLVTLVVYGAVWMLDTFLPAGAFSNAGWVWFYLIAELLVDAAFLYLGLNLMLSMRKAE